MVTKIALDGTIAATGTPTPTDTEYPQLAWVGDHAVLTYADFSASGKLMFETLDRQGRALGTPVQLGAIPTQYNRSPVISLDNGVSAVLLGGYTGNTDHTGELDVARLSPQGVPTVGPFILAKDPGRATEWRVVRHGNDMIVGWIGDTGGASEHDSGYLHLASVQP
jgi:hypothetical protein